jgi:hypothetical protein
MTSSTDVATISAVLLRGLAVVLVVAAPGAAGLSIGTPEVCPGQAGAKP